MAKKSIGSSSFVEYLDLDFLNPDSRKWDRSPNRKDTEKLFKEMAKGKLLYHGFITPYGYMDPIKLMAPLKIIRDKRGSSLVMVIDCVVVDKNSRWHGKSATMWVEWLRDPDEGGWEHGAGEVELGRGSNPYGD